MRAKSWVPDESVGMLGRDSDPFEIAAKQFELATIPIKDFYDDPVGFVKEFVDFGTARKGTLQGLTDYQAEIMGDLPKSKRKAVRGPHGLGKTTAKAFIVLWFAITRDDAGVDWKCATTAGAWRQLEKYLWPEIKKWSRKLNWEKLGLEPWRDGKELMTLSISLEHGEAFAVASSDKQKIEGVHADSVLYIFDESKSIDADIFDAAEGAFSGSVGTSGDGTPLDPKIRPLEALALASSTPGDTSGRFYDIHMRKPGFEDWSVRHVTVAEVMAAGRISEDWRSARARQWGEESALYANRVLGEFHSSSTDTTIPLSWVEAAIERWHVWRDAGRRKHARHIVLGVDVARGGKDFTALARRRGDIIEKIEKLALADTTKVVDQVQLRLASGDVAVIDVVGVGGGVYDQLRKSGYNVVPFTASRKSFRRDVSGTLGFLNRRSEMWWTMREMLDPANDSMVCLPPDDELIAELVAPKWLITEGNKIQVESKKDLIKRLGRSTDVADAVLQTFASRESPDDVSTNNAEMASAVAHTYAGAATFEDFVPGGPHTRDGAAPFGSGDAESFYAWESELNGYGAS